jgi:Uma2 family endonuclease
MSQLRAPSVQTRPPYPLEAGDKLTRSDFERRYDAMPGLKKAELIEGIVYMGSPVRFVQHGEPHFAVSGWLSYYMAKTPGVRGGDNSTVRLDDDNEPQPDLLLRIEPAAGGKSRIDEDGYLNGPVELAVEIASSSASIDTHIKMNAYRRLGIGEYLVYRVLDQAVNWYRLEDANYVEMLPDTEGVIRSKTFPGLWLSPAELIAGNLAGLFALIDQGVATPEHQLFRGHMAAAS